VIPKSHKLISHAEITKVVRTRFRFSSEFYTLFVSKNTHNSASILVTVSKKIAKSAVTRNRIRRRINGVLFDKLSKIPQQYNYLIQVTSINILRCNNLQLTNLLVDIEKAAAIVQSKTASYNKYPQKNPQKTFTK